MSTLKSMKMTAAEREKRMEAPSSVSTDAPTYPWGLSITLDNESLDKLGSDGVYNVGDEMVLIAQVKVTSVSSQESAGGKNKSVGLQITAMCLEEGDRETANAAAGKLYA